MIKTQVAKQLLQLIDSETHKVCLPIQKGNSIRIKHMVVRESRRGYLVFDILNGSQVACTFSKTAAVAIAKNHAEGCMNETHRILRLDDEIMQKYNDAVHFKYTIQCTDDEQRRASARIRYDIAWEDVLTLRSELDHYIFD